ncbi:hypothetical protein N0V84_000055 [Fusarium piperis]|uniref:Uncharacterized protein n=1 Tax=Fusarium piperis TaxID=1435070 RepID=A0A9W9BUL5_9HYPO|nr:hypothetical protein N0V84_000055 [Fusarium piperis]
MELVTERVRRLAVMDLQEIRSYIENDDCSHEAALAATLILSNHSLLGSELALFHIKAARVLIKTPTSEAMSKRAVFLFLTNQVAALDVLACATLFNPTYIKNPVLPELGPLPDGPNRHDAIRLVQAFHRADLIYAWKRLNTHEDENYHFAKLFRVFEQFEDINLSLANLSWPIFMAGVCSCGNPERIRTINDLCKTLVDSPSFQYYANIPRFPRIRGLGKMETRRSWRRSGGTRERPCWQYNRGYCNGCFSLSIYGHEGSRKSVPA